MKRKPLAALIIAQMKKPKEGASRDASDSLEIGEEEGADEGLLSAADEILMAIDANDAEGLAEALKAFVEQCY